MANSMLCFVLVSLTAAASAFAQFEHGKPDKFERATKADEKGVLQWDTYVPPKCASCAGAGKTKCTTCAETVEPKTCPECQRNKEHLAVCRACAGAGSAPDPLEKALCPTCLGAAFLLCTLCDGGGVLQVDDDKKWSDCPGCRGQGGFKCGTCNGERLVAFAAAKPARKAAEVTPLTEALAATEQSLKGLEGFVPNGENPRKSVKALLKTLAAAQRLDPALERSTKVIEAYMGKIAAGSDFEDHEVDEVAAMDLVKGNAQHYLRHHKRMLELALARARANAALAAEKKAK